MTINPLDDVAPASNSLGAITDMGQRMFDLQEEIKQLEDLLKKKKLDFTRLAEQDLPDLMQELNCRDFTLDNGTKCKIKEILSGSIPSNTAIAKARGDDKFELEVRQQQCLDWLRDNNLGDIIKSNVNVQFGKEEDQKCNDFVDDLRKKDLFYSRAVGVHHGQLNGVLNERVKDGKEIPYDLFKVYTGRKAIFVKGE